MIEIVRFLYDKYLKMPKNFTYRNLKKYSEVQMRSNSSWEVSDLEMWDDKICQVADNYDLDWFPIRYEI